VIHGEGNEVPEAEAGDVIVQVKLTPHKNFIRKGADLVIEKEIPLIQALTGVEFVVKHLDGRNIRIKNNPGEIIKHDEIKVIEGQGMPFHKKTYQNGNMFVHFKVKFPDSLDAKSLQLITSALGPSKPLQKQASTEGAVDEVVEMKKFEEYHRNLHHGGGDKGNDSEGEEDDEGHGHGGQRVGC